MEDLHKHENSSNLKTDREIAIKDIEKPGFVCLIFLQEQKIHGAAKQYTDEKNECSDNNKDVLHHVQTKCDYVPSSNVSVSKGEQQVCYVWHPGNNWCYNSERAGWEEEDLL